MPTLNWIGKEKVVNHHLDVPYPCFGSRRYVVLESLPAGIRHADGHLLAERTLERVFDALHRTRAGMIPLILEISVRRALAEVKRNRHDLSR